MTKTGKTCIALVAVLAMLIACVCGAFTVAAEEEPTMDTWHLTEDGQLLYTDESRLIPGMIQFLYIGDGTDVTVPSTVDGKPVEKVWLAKWPNKKFDSAEAEAGAWLEKVNASSQRYLNVTFEEGPTYVLVEPNIVPDYVRINSLTLPRSVQGAHLYTEGATAITVPEGSELRYFLLENVLEGVEDPQPTTVDLTGATGLRSVNINRVDYGGDCFVSGSVIKLPNEFKDVPLQRFGPSYAVDEPYFFIDYDPMPIAVQYADGSERTIASTWQETEDGQFIYCFKSPTAEVINPMEVTVLYIGDGTDVTVPAVFGGVLAEQVNLVVSDESLDADPREEAKAWAAKSREAAKRYLDLTFSEGTFSIGATPYQASGFLRVHSVTLPQSARYVRLNVAGLVDLSVPQEGDLNTLYLFNRLEGVEDPQQTTVDLTGVKRLWRLNRR